MHWVTLSSRMRAATPRPYLWALGQGRVLMKVRHVVKDQHWQYSELVGRLSVPFPGSATVVTHRTRRHRSRFSVQYLVDAVQNSIDGARRRGIRTRRAVNRIAFANGKRLRGKPTALNVDGKGCVRVHTRRQLDLSLYRMVPFWMPRRMMRWNLKRRHSPPDAFALPLNWFGVRRGKGERQWCHISQSHDTYACVGRAECFSLSRTL